MIMVVVLVCGGIAFLHWQRESAVCSYPNCAISTSDTVYASLHGYGGAVLLRKEKRKKILLASGATYTMRMVQHLSLWYYTTW